MNHFRHKNFWDIFSNTFSRNVENNWPKNHSSTWFQSKPHTIKSPDGVSYTELFDFIGCCAHFNLRWAWYRKVLHGCWSTYLIQSYCLCENNWFNLSESISRIWRCIREPECATQRLKYQTNKLIGVHIFTRPGICLRTAVLNLIVANLVSIASVFEPNRFEWDGSVDVCTFLEYKQYGCFLIRRAQTIDTWM